MATKVRKIRGNWYVVTHLNGRRKMRRVHGTRKQAEEIAREANLAIARGKLGLPIPIVPRAHFDRLAKHWFEKQVKEPAAKGARGAYSKGSVRAYGNVLDHLVEVLGETAVAEIDANTCAWVFDKLREKGFGPSRLTQASVVLRAILAYAAESDMRPHEDVVGEARRRRGAARTRSAQLDRRVPRERVLSLQEQAKLLDALRALPNPVYWRLCLLLADTGLRVGEALALCWGEVDLERRIVQIKSTIEADGARSAHPKTLASERNVDLSTRVVEMLREIGPGEPSARVFLGVPPAPREAPSYESLRNVLAKVSEAALGRKVRPHDLRHSWVSQHMALGSPLPWIQKQGGWSSAKVLLEVYAHMVPDGSTGRADALARAAEAIGNGDDTATAGGVVKSVRNNPEEKQRDAS